LSGGAEMAVVVLSGYNGDVNARVISLVVRC